ncbi:MAG TPA: glutamate--tRNA ligase [Epsilonproteobacteria bacterium]|nr:glutamate--tRNA ligase [Campylobacterota bacterium]
MLRFAQSPTHDMNIGDLRIAILNYLVSQQRHEGFTIRIDDTDKEAMIEGKDTEIMQILEKFALVHDSVFHQSEHLHMHQTLAIKLLEEGKAFVCTCNEKQEHCSGRCENVDRSEYAKLKESGEPFVLRIKKPTEAIVYHDIIKGEISTTPDEVGAFVILRQDASPTHDFASACDDMLSGVTYLIQKDKNLSSTTKQKHIKTALGYEDETTYAHLPTLINDDDTFSIKWLFEEGFLPDAIINYLLLLSNPDAPQEIFTLPEAIAWFKVENISNVAVTFDIEKLRFINREHLKNMDDKVLSTLFGFADADIGKLAKLYLEDASTVKELRLAIESIFSPKNFEGKWANQMRTMETLIQDAPMFHDYNDFEAYVLNESGLQGKDFFKALRLLLTGADHGPELSTIYPLIKPYIMEIAS